MNSTWENLKLTYYLGKILGLFPFAGRHKLISLFYSFTLWILLAIISTYISYITLNYTKTIPPRHAILIHVSINGSFSNLISPIIMSSDYRQSKFNFYLQLISIRVFFKFIVAILGVAVSAQRSNVFFELVDKFQQCDTLTLKVQSPPNFKTQSYYLLYALLTEMYYFIISYHSNDIHFITLLMWTFNSSSTMLMMIQFVVFVRIIRDKYKLANHIFLSSEYIKKHFTYS